LKKSPSPVSDPALSPLAPQGDEQSLAEIKRSSVRGGAVTLLAQGASLVLQLISTVVLARLLLPREYGVIAMVTAVTAFAGLFRDLGLSVSTIQRRQLSDAQLSTLYWINVAMGALLTVAVAASAPIVSWFYGRPELFAVTAVVSLNFLIGSFGAQPGALLTRNMRFGRIAIATLSGAVLSVALSIAFALRGFGYWSLVFGGLAGSVVSSILLNSLCGWRPGIPVKGAGVRSLLRFGANVTAFDFVNYFHRNLDNILIGRMWGADALGLYSRAYSLLMFPINNIRGPLNAVAFPAMSRLQTQPLQLKAYYRRVTAFVAFLSMPIMAFVFVGAIPVVQLTLGDRWLGVAPIFTALAATGFIQPVTTMFGVVVLSAGLARRYLKLGLFNTVCMCTGFIVGSFYGPRGVAIGYGVATYVTAYPLMYWTFQGLPITLRDFAQAIFRPAIASVIAATGTSAIAKLIIHPSPLLELTVMAGVFGPMFILCFLALPGGREEIAKMISIKDFLGWDRTPKPDRPNGVDPSAVVQDKSRESGV
jgi:polysaccharide transporter, PST family